MVYKKVQRLAGFTARVSELLEGFALMNKANATAEKYLHALTHTRSVPLPSLTTRLPRIAPHRSGCYNHRAVHLLVSFARLRFVSRFFFSLHFRALFHTHPSLASVRFARAPRVLGLVTSSV